MTASPEREVDANLLSGAALGGAKARTDAQDAGRQDLGDLVEALDGSHKVGVEWLGHQAARKCTFPRSLTDRNAKMPGRHR